MVMAVAYAFTFTAFIAVLLHSWYVARVTRNRFAVSREPQQIQAVARALQQVETVRFFINLTMFIAGVGIVAGGPFRVLGYLLAAIPILSMAASTIALRRL